MAKIGEPVSARMLVAIGKRFIKIVWISIIVLFISGIYVGATKKCC